MMNLYKKLALVKLMLILAISCAPKNPRPVMTMAEYVNQVTKIREVVNKLMAETDVKVMNFMADGVETTRAIPCDSIGEECNAYYEFINKVVDLTRDGDLSEADREILVASQRRVYLELANSEKIIQGQWKSFLNEQESK